MSNTHYTIDKRNKYVKLKLFMNKVMFWEVRSCCWKKTKFNFWSSLPYSVLQHDLIPQLPRVQLKIYPLKWRNCIVSLRAPKHFKVGRQQYSQPRRLATLTINNLNKNWVFTPKNSFKLQKTIQSINTSQQLTLPLTSVKMITNWVVFKIKILPVL